jgi:signal transduction histidine kinase
MARFVADTPVLKAALATNDPETIKETAREYQEQWKPNLLLLTNRLGQVMATVGASPQAAATVASQPAVREALAGHETVGLLPQPDGVLQLVTVPIVLTRPAYEILGTLSVGFLIGDALAAQLKGITGSDIAFGMDGQILASSLPAAHRGQLAPLLRRSQMTGEVTIGDEKYVVLPRPLATGGGGSPGAGPVVLILRSRTEQLRLLQDIHAGLALTAVVAVLLATLLGFAVARTITRPLAAITDVMREVAATGDLTRKIALRAGHRWEDEDARLLASTFNTLTDSIARFQREISQKERLSSLGRLSTVIAHEVRNPLMIIKASLHSLRQPEVSPSALREAIADIDEEVARLNRVVNEVLDFARPIRFELAAVDLNALCRESAAAAQAAAGAPVTLDLDTAAPTLTTDGERLRIALVNMLLNARHAVAAQPRVEAPGPLVTLATRADNGRVRIVIADRGIGINAADLARVFDPYFTTKRGGTGLGLPIAKNIVEGLGGTIGVTSTPGRGTEIRIELPTDPPVALRPAAAAPPAQARSA